MAATLLSVTDLRKEYGTVSVLAGVTFTLAGGASMAVMGPSGSGKSTLLNIVGALDEPTGGTVAFDGGDVHRLGPDARAAFRNRSVGFVFQDHHLLPQCTALENVLVPWLASGRAGAAEVAAGRELLARVGMAGKELRFPSELSGGERQRVAVARALVTGPRLLLCDEPTGNLDAATGAAVVKLFCSLRDERGVAVLVVTHNDAVAAAIGRTARLESGRLHE